MTVLNKYITNVLFLGLFLFASCEDKIEKKEKKHTGKIAVCTAGTADIPVAEEAAQTAEYFGAHVDRIFDVDRKSVV